jgi:hypothetical protein
LNRGILSAVSPYMKKAAKGKATGKTSKSSKGKFSAKKKKK